MKLVITVETEQGYQKLLELITEHEDELDFAFVCHKEEE